MRAPEWSEGEERHNGLKIVTFFSFVAMAVDGGVIGGEHS